MIGKNIEILYKEEITTSFSVIKATSPFSQNILKEPREGYKTRNVKPKGFTFIAYVTLIITFITLMLP